MIFTCNFPCWMIFTCNFHCWMIFTCNFHCWMIFTATFLVGWFSFATFLVGWFSLATFLAGWLEIWFSPPTSFLFTTVLSFLTLWNNVVGFNKITDLHNCQILFSLIHLKTALTLYLYASVFWLTVNDERNVFMQEFSIVFLSQQLKCIWKSVNFPRNEMFWLTATKPCLSMHC